jgi:2-C-methyl-D-erythritol 2,4-cyclodiphosphate synthase
MAVGIGFDIHRLVKGRKFPLGGLLIDYKKGPVGHSDGDVVLHALCDAILGATGKGDIGERFPESDPRFKDIESSKLVLDVVKEIKNIWRVENVDINIFLEEPQLGELKGRLRRNVADLLGIKESLVNVKAQTMEGLGVIGSKDAVAASVIIQLEIR